LHDLRVKQDTPFFEVYARPSDAESLASSESESCCQDDCGIDRIIFCKIQQCKQFFFAVICALEFILFRSVDAIEGIGIDQLVFEGLLKCFAKDCVVVDYRV